MKLMLILLSLLVLGCEDNGGQTAGKQRAPDFAIKTFDGALFRLGDHKGRRVVVNFFSSWCVTCGTETGNLQEAYEAQRDKTVTFVGVAIDDTEEKAKAFLKKNAITYPAGVDVDGSIKKNYAVYGLPFTFLIDREGFIHAIHAGAITKDLLIYELDKMRGGNDS